jgi:hypothetical protein
MTRRFVQQGLKGTAIRVRAGFVGPAPTLRGQFCWVARVVCCELTVSVAAHDDHARNASHAKAGSEWTAKCRLAPHADRRNCRPGRNEQRARPHAHVAASPAIPRPARGRDGAPGSCIDWHMTCVD